MKPIHIFLATVVVASFVLPVTAEGGDTRSVEVTGIGVVSQRPDVAKVAFSVETQGKDVEKATKFNASRTARLIDGIKKLGLDTLDIQTRHYRVTPRYPDRQRSDRDLQPMGYTVHNTINVTIHDLRKVGALMDRATASGADRVNHIRFEHSDPTQARSQALERAVENARAEASILVGKAGAMLGPVLQMRTGGPHYAPKVERMMASAARADTPIEPGLLETRAQVTIRFRIE